MLSLTIIAVKFEPQYREGHGPFIWDITVKFTYDSMHDRLSISDSLQIQDLNKPDPMVRIHIEVRRV